MEGNVAVNQPDAGVVCLEADDDVALRWEENNVTARRVVQVVLGGVVCCRVPKLVVHFAENGKVMAV